VAATAAFDLVSYYPSLDERSKRRHDMSQATRTTYDVGPFFHTISHYNSPADVLKDARLSTDEKRVVL